MQKQLQKDTQLRSSDKIDQSLHLSNYLANSLCRDIYKGYVLKKVHTTDDRSRAPSRDEEDPILHESDQT